MKIKGRLQAKQNNTMWQQWVNFVLGLWIVVSAYISFTAFSLTTNLTIVGLAVAVIGLWGAIEHHAMMMKEHPERRHGHA